MSPTPEGTLADPRQIIADLRRELDECRAERDKAQRKLDETTIERDEAIAQQAAAAEVLRVINSSPGDLTPVFDALLEKATRLCGAPFGVLRTWDGERFHVAAANGDAKFTEWAWNYGPFAPAQDSSPAGRIVRGEDIVRFADCAGRRGCQYLPRIQCTGGSERHAERRDRCAAQGRHSAWQHDCLPARSPAVQRQ